MKNTLALLLLAILFCTSCKKESDNPYAFSAEAKAYLDEVVDLMEEGSVRKYEIDWKDFRDQAYKAASPANTIEQTYPGIKHALHLLGDEHSYLVTAAGDYLSGSPQLEPKRTIDQAERIGDIAYISIEGTTDPYDSPEGIAYMDNIVDQIKSNDQVGTQGWIIDLHGNQGGEMWAMLTAVGPLLGNGVAGYFVNADKEWIEWGFQDAYSMLDGQKVIGVPGNYVMQYPPKKVAILLDASVAGSAEAIAIAFMGKENAKSFGQATKGLPVANQRYNISDGSILVLTTAYLANRNRQVYRSHIVPDQISNSSPLEDAIFWIQE